jgi:cellulose synthase/poly-beta-1,6-N-acetylglucosamine synthase-like glycosyltransferase
MTFVSDNSACVSAIVPARNEQAVIAACVESLARQAEICEALVIDDQSTDETATIIQQLARTQSKIRYLKSHELPVGWVGKNNAVWRGAREAQGQWLLFTDADAVHAENSAKSAMEIAERENAALVSFSPEQVMETWYEKALIPYVYCRLGSRFSYAEVNDPRKAAAAANGQFLMIRRDIYNAVGGHASVASDVLEDVALAKKVKSSGYQIWFGSGTGVVRVRMYRSFGAMWEGWKKNLYPLMGGSPEAIGREFFRAIGPVLAACIAAVTTWVLLGNWIITLGVFLAGFVGVAVAYGDELRRNHFPPRLVCYGMLGRLLFARLLWASYGAHKRGKLKWKGREYPVSTSRASNG